MRPCAASPAASLVLLAFSAPAIRFLTRAISSLSLSWVGFCTRPQSVSRARRLDALLVQELVQELV